MRGIFLVVVLICLVAQRSSYGAELTNEKRLIDDLLRNYNKNAIPVNNRTALPINVELKITLRRIIEMKETEQSLVTDIWLAQRWRNDFMKWDPDDYNGIKNVNILKQRLWLPDTLILNDLGNDTNKHFNDNSTLLYLQYDGMQLTYFPLIVSTACKLDLSTFPFDEQSCQIDFSAWTSDETRVKYSHPTKFNRVQYEESRSWKLLSGHFSITSNKYQCCKNPFSGVTLEIKIRRNSMFYGFILLFPITMAWIPILLGFVAPTATGERISFSISVLLTLVFYIEVANKALPRSSNNIPLFGQYYAGVVVVIVTSTLLTAVSTKFFHSRQYAMSSDFNRVQKVLLSLGARVPYIGRKCRYLLELKQKAVEEAFHRRIIMSSVFAMTGDTSFQQQEQQQQTADEKDVREEQKEARMVRFINRIQQCSLDEGFVEENNDPSRQQLKQKSLLRKRNNDAKLEEEKEETGTTSETQNKNLHVTDYRLKLYRLHSISRYLGSIIEAIRRKRHRDREQSKQEQYANAIVDLIDRINLTLFTMVLVAWFGLTIGQSLIKIAQHDDHGH